MLESTVLESRPHLKSCTHSLFQDPIASFHNLPDLELLHAFYIHSRPSKRGPQTPLSWQQRVGMRLMMSGEDTNPQDRLRAAVCSGCPNVLFRLSEKADSSSYGQRMQRIYYVVT